MPDVIDSRDLLQELRDLLGDPYYDYGNDPADAHREEGYEDLAATWAELEDEDKRRVQDLRRVLDELPESTEDSTHGNSWGCTLVSEGYFTTYAEEMAADIGAIDPDASWPLNRIDWEAAADDLKVDYTTVELDGVTYYAR